MITVRNMPIMVDEIEILNTIKERVFQEQGREILRKIKRSGNNIMVSCPVHKEGQERKPSCGILVVDRKDHKAGDFHCFTCGAVGNFSEFVSLCFGKDDKGIFGEKWLLENFISGEFYERPELEQLDHRNPLSILNKLTKRNIRTDYVSEEELAKYRFYHPYMWERHLTPEVVEKYDVGYQKDFRLVTKNEEGEDVIHPPVECLTFPCRDEHGNCLFVSRRAIYNKNFFLPPNIEKPVYGIYELPKNADTIVICESVFNALTCATWGIPAVALFGTGDANQYEQLNSMLSCRHFILGLDPDSAGNKGSWKLNRYIKGRKVTRLVIPKGKDINDLTYQEFCSLPEIYL